MKTALKCVDHHCSLALGGQSESCSLTCEGAESYAAAHELIEGDPAAHTVALHDAVHGLRAQIVTCGQTSFGWRHWRWGDCACNRLCVSAVPMVAMACCSSVPSTVPLWSRSKDMKVPFQPFRAWHSSLNSWKPMEPDMSLWHSSQSRSHLIPVPVTKRLTTPPFVHAALWEDGTTVPDSPHARQRLPRIK